MPLTGSEAARKLVHVAAGGLAFLLAILTWPQAALLAALASLHNWLLLPRIGGRRLWRDRERDHGHARGIVIYPLSVLGLVLVFRHELWMAAAVWGVLAFGDGMASLAGQALRGPSLPWNAEKTWIGLASFVAFGVSGAAVLTAWTLGLPPEAAGSPRVLGLLVPLVVVCAMVESLPTTLDDNFTVAAAGAVLLPLLVHARADALLSDPGLAPRVATGLALNLAFAVAARAVGSLDIAGALSAVVIGTVIAACLGLAGLGVMVAFFVVGTGATRLGFGIKRERGIAQAGGGVRGWRNAWANGGVPAFLALMAGLSPEWRAAYILAYAAAVATAAADTCASEIGKAYGRRPLLITTLRPVPPGTEGAISLEGSAAGLLGGMIVASIGAGLGLYPWSSAALVTAAALLGSLAESVIGSMAERRGWIGNDGLNALNTAIGAGLVVGLERLISAR